MPRLSVPDLRPWRADQHSRGLRKSIEKENPGFEWKSGLVLALAAAAAMINVEKEVEKHERRHAEEDRQRDQRRERTRAKEPDRSAPTPAGARHRGSGGGGSPSSKYGDRRYRGDDRGHRRSRRDRAARHSSSSGSSSDGDEDEWYGTAGPSRDYDRSHHRHHEGPHYSTYGDGYETARPSRRERAHVSHRYR